MDSRSMPARPTKAAQHAYHRALKLDQSGSLTGPALLAFPRMTGSTLRGVCELARRDGRRRVLSAALRALESLDTAEAVRSRRTRPAAHVAVRTTPSRTSGSDAVAEGYLFPLTGTLALAFGEGLEAFGEPIPDAPGGLIRTIGSLLQVGLTGSHAVAARQAFRQGGRLVELTENSARQLHDFGEALDRSGNMLLVVRGQDGRFADVLRGRRSTSTAAGVSSLHGLLVAAAVLASQHELHKSVHAVRRIVAGEAAARREDQLAAVLAMRVEMVDALIAALHDHRVTLDLLPPRHLAYTALTSAHLEMERHLHTLEELPPRAGDRLAILQETLPDATLAITRYVCANETWALAQAMHVHHLRTEGRPSAAALRDHWSAESEHRQSLADELAARLDAELARLEANPGKAGWFGGRSVAEVRTLVRQTRATLHAHHGVTTSLLAAQPAGARSRTVTSRVSSF